MSDEALTRFHIDRLEERRTNPRYTLEPGSYEAWLWADEIAICRELGCEVTERNGWGWIEWGPPATTPSQSRYRKERGFIYALADPLTEEVRYIGKSVDPERRLNAHLRDTDTSDKGQWIRGLDERGYKPALLILEEVVGGVALEEREYYWTVFYYDRGDRLTNAICQQWKEFPENPGNHSYWRRQHAREQRAGKVVCPAGQV